ncbi:MAG: hypothetical protein IT548_18115 [Alphaproteobacteria bacterium]|nr:hypothetical protein [Alphaproteobacteria bacterium]
MRPALLALVGAAVFAGATAQAEHDSPFIQMSFLKGDWVQVSKGETVEEHWIGPTAGTMAGVTISYTDAKDALGRIEFMSIEQRNGRITFIARIGDEAPVAFPLKESDNGYAVFENPAHAFPQRVVYAYGGDDTLDARIEGTKDGKPLTIGWHYVRMKPAP